VVSHTFRAKVRGEVTGNLKGSFDGLIVRDEAKHGVNKSVYAGLQSWLGI
jgi:hypothetical protein